MMRKRHIATLAAIVGCAVGLAAPAMAATAAPTTTARPAAATAIPRGLRPMAASWLTPQRGIVFGYQQRATNAKPYLITTGNVGKTWQSLDDGNWNALSLPWIVGPKGRIAKLGALPSQK